MDAKTAHAETIKVAKVHLEEILKRIKKDSAQGYDRLVYHHSPSIKATNYIVKSLIELGYKAEDGGNIIVRW